MPDDFDLRLLGLVLGTLMSSLVLGYLVLSEVKPKHREDFSGVHAFVGGYNLALGLFLGAGWINLFLQRMQHHSTMVPGATPGPFTPEVFIHAGLELGAAIALVHAGWALLRNHPFASRKLYSAIALLFFAQAWGMLLFGVRGHLGASGSGILGLALMDTGVTWALMIFSGLTGFCYGWEHYLLKLDKRSHRLPMPHVPEDVSREARERAASAARKAA